MEVKKLNNQNIFLGGIKLGEMTTGICGGRSANKNKKKNDLRRENVGGSKGKGPKG